MTSVQVFSAMHRAELRPGLLVGAAGLVAFLAPLYFWQLGTNPFYTKGEPREAVQVWDEVHRGEWILPMRNGTDLPSKPPLFHWLGGLASLARGDVDELSVRLPSALLATASVLATAWLGALRFGGPAGLVAALVLATSFEWVSAATSARVDMTLTAFLVGAFVALERIVTAEKPSPAALLAFYLCMGLAALGKGPVGLLLPALTAGVYLYLRGDLARVWRMRPFAGGTLALAIPLWWYAFAIATGGEAFVRKQILVENFGRFFAADATGAGHVHPFPYLIGAFLRGFFPWSLFLPPLAAYLYSRRGRLDRLGYLYPMVWFTTVLVFYSLSQSKRSVYVLPIYPAASLLFGAWWQELSSETHALSRSAVAALYGATAALAVVALAAAATLVATAGGLAPILLVTSLLREKDRASLPLVQEIVSGHLPVLAAWVVAVGCGAAALGLGIRMRRFTMAFAPLVAILAASTLLVRSTLQPEVAARRTFKPFLAEVRRIVGPDDALYFHQAFDYGAVFYAERRIPSVGLDFGPPPEPGHSRYVLTWRSVWDTLPPESKAALEHVGTSSGTGWRGLEPLVLARVRAPGGTGAILASPDDHENGE